MTEFIIPADIFLRLSGVALQPDETHNLYNDGLRSVRIEHANGQAVAVASCGHILAVEHIGPAHYDNAVINVSINQRMIGLARSELEKNGALHINQAPGWSIAKGTHGAMCPVNAEVTGDWPDWRALVPSELPKKNNGFFMFGANYISRLALSAPSSAFVIQSHADVRQPVVVRDIADIRWMGMFLITHEQHQQPSSVDLPGWL